MRVAIFVLSVSLAAGCSPVSASNWDQAEAACEAYIQGALKAPATYKQTSSSQSLTYFNEPDFRRSFSVPDGVNLPRPGVHGVTVTYDADNPFGVPLRGTEHCFFGMTDVENGNYLDSDLLDVAQQRAVAVLAQGLPSAEVGAPENFEGCCAARGVSSLDLSIELPAPFELKED